MRSPDSGGAALFEGDVHGEGRERDGSCCTAGCGSIPELLDGFRKQGCDPGNAQELWGPARSQAGCRWLLVASWNAPAKEWTGCEVVAVKSGDKMRVIETV